MNASEVLVDCISLLKAKTGRHVVYQALALSLSGSYRPTYDLRAERSLLYKRSMQSRPDLRFSVELRTLDMHPYRRSSSSAAPPHPRSAHVPSTADAVDYGLEQPSFTGSVQSIAHSALAGTGSGSGHVDGHGASAYSTWSSRQVAQPQEASRFASISYPSSSRERMEDIPPSSFGGMPATVGEGGVYSQNVSVSQEHSKYMLPE